MHSQENTENSELKQERRKRKRHPSPPTTTLAVEDVNDNYHFQYEKGCTCEKQRIFRISHAKPADTYSVFQRSNYEQL